MQPLGTKKSHNISGLKEITQPLGQDKKSRNLLGQKKSCNLLGTKNHTNSQDKKKSCNPQGQKNHATSQDKKKILQSLQTKKSFNLYDNKHHATSWDKKITLSIDPIASKLVHRASNCSKWHQICPNWSKQVNIGPNGYKLVQMNGSKWENQFLIGPNWFK